MESMWKIRRAGDSRARHQHDASEWWYDMDQSAWLGRCRSCGRTFEATPLEAIRLERAVDNYVTAERIRAEGR